MDSGGL